MAVREEPELDPRPPPTPRALAHALDTWRETQEGTPRAGEPPLVHALTVLYHPDPDRAGDHVLLHDLTPEQPILLSRTRPDFASYRRPTAEPLADPSLSRGALRLVAAEHGGLRLELGEHKSRVNVRGAPLSGARTFSRGDIERGVVIELAGRVVLLLHSTASAATTGVFATCAGDPASARILGESLSVRRLRHEIRRVADLPHTVLIRGETGTGKELVAGAIHGTSPRRAAPFVSVNVGAITPTLIYGELFGVERGAATGALPQPGYFARAEGGTLFLDEIGEAPAAIQAALLRALEDKEIQPVGAQKPRKVDVRVIAATDANLERMIEAGAFRSPLLHRLAGYEIWVPPLRERRDDFGRLLVHFLEQELATTGGASPLRAPPRQGELWLPAYLVARLADYDWPGNVRQLRNVVRQLVVGNRGRSAVGLTPGVERLMAPARPDATRPGPEPATEVSVMVPKARPSEVAPAPGSPSSAAAPAAKRRSTEISEEALADALRRARWDLTAAAEHLGIPRTSIYDLIAGNPRFRTAGDLSPDQIAQAHADCDGDVEKMVDRLEVSAHALRRRVRELGLEDRASGEQVKRARTR